MSQIRSRLLRVFVCLAAVAIASGGVAVPAFADATEPPEAVLSMLPPPEVTDSPGSGTWQHDSSTRILVTNEALATEAARLAEELVALGMLESVPSIALTPDALTGISPTDIVLSTGASAPTLEVTSEGLRVSGTDAIEVFRATRPLLQQLVATGELPAAQFVFNLPSEQIRAVHIDIARKHYPIASLEALLYEMSWYGMNELELHFSENEGFAIASTTHPEIASPNAHSQSEIVDLVELANSLHVRVTPSLDMPGHLDYALETHPEWRLRDPSGGEVFGALDITEPDALSFADDLIREYSELFAQPQSSQPLAWHLGGDEFVDFGDDYEVAALTALAQEEFGADATAYDALTAFVNDIAATVRSAGFQPRVFSDGMLRAQLVDLDPEIEVAYWTQRPPDAVPASEFAAQGYSLVNLNDEYLYFVLGERVDYYYPTGEAILASWNATVYPSVGGVPEIIPESKGGMLAIWSDIPAALSPEEVVDAVRALIAAMAVKLAVPGSVMSFADLTAAIDASGRPARVVAHDPGALPSLAAETTSPPVDSSGSDGPTGGVSGALASPWLWWAGGVLTLVALTVAAVSLRRRSR